MGADGTRWLKAMPKVKRSARAADSSSGPDISGVTDEAIHAQTIRECWSLFFPEEMIERIVLCTNMHIEETACEAPYSADTCFTDVVEIRALFGMLYTIGVYYFDFDFKFYCTWYSRFII